MKWEPDGFFFSNGPGDPNATASYALDTVNNAKETGKPMFGICLGHQLMAFSEGIKVGKMFVGHRGANHPVQHLTTKLVEITTQNHGFSVEPESVNNDVAEITHINLNDKTVEGLKFNNFNGFSVQYHPEASPGPHDSSYLFDEFIRLIKPKGKIPDKNKKPTVNLTPAPLLKCGEGRSTWEKFSIINEIYTKCQDVTIYIKF